MEAILLVMLVRLRPRSHWRVERDNEHWLLSQRRYLTAETMTDNSDEKMSGTTWRTGHNINNRRFVRTLRERRVATPVND